MSRIAIVTDTHFNHPRCVEYDGRAVDSDQRIASSLQKGAAEAATRRQHGCVDVLVHLGDVGFGTAASDWHRILLASGYAKKYWLVRGNHDEGSLWKYLELGWDAVADSLSINRHGFEIHFTHKPMAAVGPGMLNIHGHMHMSLHTKTHMGLHLPDNGYAPFSLDALLKQHRKFIAGKA